MRERGKYRVKDDNRSNYRGGETERWIEREDKRGINCSAVGEKEGSIE